MVEISNSKIWSKIYKNIPLGAGSTNSVIRLLKDDLKTAGWTHKISCNAVTTSSSSDLWSSNSDIVYALAPTAHSWIVLGNDNLCSGLEMCIDLNTSGAGKVRVYIATTGFSGGSNTAKPIATNEVEVTNGDTAYVSVSDANSKQYNLFYSSDGECFRTYLGYSGTNVYGFFFVEKIQNAPSWLSIPVVVHIGVDITRDGFVDKGCSNVDGVRVPIRIGGLVLSSTFVVDLTSLNSGDYGSNWTSDRVIIVSNIAYFSGMFGYLADLWHAIDDLVNFDYFPGDGSKAQVVLGDFIQGSDGSTVSL